MRGGGTTPVRFRDTAINLYLDVLKCKRLVVVHDSSLSELFCRAVKYSWQDTGLYISMLSAYIVSRLPSDRNSHYIIYVNEKHFILLDCTEHPQCIHDVLRQLG